MFQRYRKFPLVPGGVNQSRFLARQGSDIAVFEGIFGLKSDLNHLFAVGCHRGALVADLCDMDDPEIDLRLDPPRAGSQSVTFGES